MLVILTYIQLPQITRPQQLNRRSSGRGFSVSGTKRGTDDRRVAHVQQASSGCCWAITMVDFVFSVSRGTSIFLVLRLNHNFEIRRNIFEDNSDVIQPEPVDKYQQGGWRSMMSLGQRTGLCWT